MEGKIKENLILLKVILNFEEDQVFLNFIQKLQSWVQVLRPNPNRIESIFGTFGQSRPCSCHSTSLIINTCLFGNISGISFRRHRFWNEAFFRDSDMDVTLSRHFQRRRLKLYNLAFQLYGDKEIMTKPSQSYDFYLLWVAQVSLKVLM